MNATTSRPETLSPWWRHAPPIPETVIGPTEETLFTKTDIVAGQQVFLKYGLMDNGSIWGHGAYRGPDFSAAYLHHLVEDTQVFLTQPADALTRQSESQAVTAISGTSEL